MCLQMMLKDIQEHVNKNNLKEKNVSINIPDKRGSRKLIDLNKLTDNMIMMYSDIEYKYFEPIIEKCGRSKMCTYIVYR